MCPTINIVILYYLSFPLSFPTSFLNHFLLSFLFLFFTKLSHKKSMSVFVSIATAVPSFYLTKKIPNYTIPAFSATIIVKASENILNKQTKQKSTVDEMTWSVRRNKNSIICYRRSFFSLFMALLIMYFISLLYK